MAEENMCQHQPRCRDWPAPDHLAARIVADQPGQGWSLLCNGVSVYRTSVITLRTRRAEGGLSALVDRPKGFG
jgi:hypothetical protein